MVLNPMGLQLVDDGGVPRIFTAVAKQNVSGGMAVFCSGAADTVSSGVSSFDFGDVGIYGGNAASGMLFNGLAMFDASSGAEIAVLTRGRVIVTVDAGVTAGDVLACVGSNSFRVAAGFSAGVGKALTDATSGGYVLMDLRP